MKHRPTPLKLQQIAGANIEQIRHLRKKSIKEMAALLDMSVSGYRNIERGITDISLSKIEKLAHILDVNFLQFFELNYATVMDKKKDLENNRKLEESFNIRIQQYREENNYLKKQIDVLDRVIKKDL